MTQPHDECWRTALAGKLDVRANTSFCGGAVDLNIDRTVIGRCSLNRDALPIGKPCARGRLADEEDIVRELVEQQIAIKLEPRAIGARRPEVLAPRPAMLDGLE